MCFFNQHLGFLHSPVGFLLSNTAFSLSNRAFPFLGFYSSLFFDSFHPFGCYLSSFRLLSTILSVAIYHPFGCYLSSFRLLSIILSVAIYHPFGCYLPSFRLLSTILSVAISLFPSFRAFSPRFRPAVSSPHVRFHRWRMWVRCRL